MRYQKQKRYLTQTNMALSNDERQSLIELKEQGYSFSEAMGFLGSSRMGNASRVTGELLQDDTAPQDDSAGADLKRGFGEAQTRFQEGLERQDTASQRETGLGRLSGTLGAGFRAAGEATGSLLGGAIRAVPGGTTAMNKIEDVVGTGVEKSLETGVPQKIGEQFEKLPEGVQTGLGDLGNVAMGAAGIAEPLVAPGATRAVSTAIKTGLKKIEDSSSIVGKSGVTQSGTAGITEALTKGLAPEDIMQRVARVSKGKQIKFEERAGESIGEYLVSRDIFGTPEQIFDQLFTRMQQSKSRVDRRLAAIDGLYKSTAVKNALTEITAKEAAVGVPGRESQRIATLAKKHKNEGLTLSEVNEVKRILERNVRVDYFKEVNTAGIEKTNRIDSDIRDFIEQKATAKGFNVVAQLNKETSLAKQLADNLSDEYAGSAGNNAVSITDWILLSEGATSPAALAGFVGKKIASSKTMMSATARIMAKNKGLKKDLPDAPVQNEQGLKGYLKFLDEQGLREDVKKNASRRADIDEANQQIAMELRAQMLDIPETGTATLPDGGMIRTTSFPSFVPSHLRSKARFERVLDHIEDGTKPRANAGKDLELYDLVKNEVNNRKKKLIDQPKQDTGVGTDAAFGGVAGVEVDDEGNITFNPFAGAAGIVAMGSIKKFADIKVTPETVAKNMDDIDLAKISAWLDNPKDPQVNVNTDTLFRAVGIPDSTDQAIKERFLKEVTDEYAKKTKPAKAKTNLLEEAKKYGTASLRDKYPDMAEAMFRLPDEISVYRGSGKGIGNSTLVKGEYWADSSEFASTFGNVTEETLPKNTAIFDLDMVKNDPTQKLVPGNLLVDQEALTDFLVDKGIEYTKNTNSRGVEFVKLNKLESQLRRKAEAMKMTEFKNHVMQNYEKYRDELARISRGYTQADMSRRRSPIEDIWKKANE